MHGAARASSENPMKICSRDMSEEDILFNAIESFRHVYFELYANILVAI